MAANHRFSHNQFYAHYKATANSLRSNLEQVLQHVGGGEERISSAVDDDAESCCGSTDGGGREAEAQDKEEGNGGDRWCRMCGEREPCVLLLSCWHLCLCSVCGSGPPQLPSCPVCNSVMTMRECTV